ncbi:MAG: hypothetical protein AB1374_05930 [Bacillota bacterium]
MTAAKCKCLAVRISRHASRRWQKYGGEGLLTVRRVQGRLREALRRRLRTGIG